MCRVIPAALMASIIFCGTIGAEDANADRLAWWKAARFGMFIHWGPVSLKGTEIGWSRGGERRGTGGTGEIPVEVYDNLYKEFNPVKFNAKEWVALAQAAGMKYLVFTTKHHDGFAMFDSALTDYKITNSPFGRDVVKELADACQEAGLRLGFYYSPPDWHHPDYRTENHQRYIDYLHGQIRELCTNYGQVDILWFDGLGGTAADWDAVNLVKMIRELQPQIIINDRAGLPEDHATPEQKVGAFQRDRAWESCITICNQWAWKPDDNLKSLEECIGTLVRCVGGDGNLLLNVGPMPTGEIEPRQAERLREIGAWLTKYGSTIYGTRGGPFLPDRWGASTCLGERVNIHVLEWPDGPLRFPLDMGLVTGDDFIAGKGAIVGEADSLTLSQESTPVQELDTIVQLVLKRSAESLEPASALH
ncbi:MAG: alpha-L-fucosidase [Candidatus Hydrogenedentes bacterium]|nr:alpha-L-fucosidase [Candidatus Hydrogenedentota bacterium]